MCAERLWELFSAAISTLACGRFRFCATCDEVSVGRDVGRNVRVSATSEQDIIEYHVDVTEREMHLMPVRMRLDVRQRVACHHTR